MKNKLNRILILSLTFLISMISFIRVEAIESYQSIKHLNRIELLEVKDKEEVLVENNEIFEFYEENVETLEKLIEEKERIEEKKRKEKERIEREKRLNFKKEIVEFSKQFVGNPYVSGGTSLTSGADCSGFVQSVFRTFNISLPRTTSEQAVVGKGISIEQIEIGDIVSYGYNGSATHSAIYIGNGMIIHSSTPELGIRLDSMYIMPIVTIRRIV